MERRRRPTGKRGEPPAIFAGVDRQAPAAKRPKPSANKLAVHGLRCQLFEDGSGAAAAFEAGEHLLPAFGDGALTVDRFDARLLLPAAPSLGPRRNGGNASGGSESHATVGPDERESELDAERYRDLREASGASDLDDEDALAQTGQKFGQL